MIQLRNLVLILGDQLDKDLSALDGFDAARDIVWMAENDTEATHVWCHKKRLVLFFSAMRHYRDALRERGFTVHYHALTTDKRRDSGRDFAEILTASINARAPQRLVMTECGDDRVRRMLAEAARTNDIPLQTRPDRHFYCALEEFNDWVDGRKGLVLEHFYRTMRRKHDVLMNRDEPVDGA